MQVFKPAVAPAALFLALSLSGRLPLWAEAFFSSFIFLVCMSQQFHAWSHMKKSELHPAVVALQEAGLLIGRKAHGAHHRAPFEGNYCIVSGWWNELLDNSQFFRWVARSTAGVLGSRVHDRQPVLRAMLVSVGCCCCCVCRHVWY